MQAKMDANPKLKAIMEEVQTNPMAIMQCVTNLAHTQVCLDTLCAADITASL